MVGFIWAIARQLEDRGQTLSEGVLLGNFHRIIDLDARSPRTLDFRIADTIDMICCSSGIWGIELEQDMQEKTQTSSEPSWLDPRNDRRTPFSDAELDVLADDFIARMADTQAWQDLAAEVGKQRARELVKQRLAAQDANSLINWQPNGLLH
jgi:hypothetical protein